MSRSLDSSRIPVVAFSHTRWAEGPRRPQHLLARLARQRPVFFVEEPVGDDDAAWLEHHEACTGVTVLTPHLPVQSPGFHDDHLATLQSLIGRQLRQQGVDETIAWLGTPMALPLLGSLAPRAVVFDSADDGWPHDELPRQWHQRESLLLRWSDLVLTRGPSHHEETLSRHRHALCLAGGADAQLFAPQGAASRIDTMLRAEQVQGRIPGPRLGCFGVIDERIDFGLIHALAAARADWQIVMVGPVRRVDPLELPRRSNIHWLGAQPEALLPQLVADWDVCLVPHAMNDAARLMGCGAVLDYMAADKPVVCTPQRDLVSLFGDVLRFGHDAPSFIAACDWALRESPDKRAERVAEMHAVVAVHSWERAVQSLHEALAQLLAAPRRADAPWCSTPERGRANCRELREAAV
ncbi:glycosyltransferase [Piscinibacter terrae]|nr:glycosyltransferase [Albitalea terrae]